MTFRLQPWISSIFIIAFVFVVLPLCYMTVKDDKAAATTINTLYVSDVGVHHARVNAVQMAVDVDRCSHGHQQRGLPCTSRR